MKRKLFHSERDFQHALAWEIHTQYPDLQVRLEKRVDLLDEPTYLDILVTDGSWQTAIELKYKARAIFAVVNNEVFWLKDQSAQDQGRYDYLKDVQRLENFVFKYNRASGYALILTNDSSYWKASVIPNTVDADFRIHDGRILTGQLNWGTKASAGTTKGRTQSIALKNKYISKWHDYSMLESTEIKDGNYVRFKYQCLEVK